MSARSVTMNRAEAPAGAPKLERLSLRLAGRAACARRERRPLRAAGRALAAGLLAVLIASASGAGPADTVYTVTDLGTLGGDPITPTGINNHGQVVGYSTTPAGHRHSFLWDQGSVTDLGSAMLGVPNDSQAWGINDAGQIVGLVSPPSTSMGHAFLYDGSFHDLGTLPGTGNVSSAAAINASSHVVGSFGDPSQTYAHAFLYDGSGVRDLGTLPGFTFSEASGINASDQVAGTLRDNTSNNVTHAFLWQDGVMRDLGVLAGPHSEAAAINDKGQVVGYTDVRNTQGYFTPHAFLYDGTGMHDLGTLSADPRVSSGTSFANGINNLGQIVGTSDMFTPAQRAFLYSDGVMYDLNQSYLLDAPQGAVLTEARAINDRGQIACLATIDGQSHAVLLTPTPAPLARFSPASVSFPAQALGGASAPQTVQITNAGTLPLTVKSLTITGDDAAEFAVVSDSGETTLAPGASRTVQVTFTPAFAGSRSATLTIDDGAPAGNPRTVSLSGSGTAPAMTLGDNVSFGSQLVGTTSADQTVTVLNTGAAPLLLKDASLAGPNAGDFAVDDVSGISIAPGQSQAVSVRFSPTGRGALSATLSIAGNAPNSPQTVSLTGTGIGPVLRLVPTTLDFGPQPVGLSGSQAVLLQNTGDAPLDVKSLAFQGPNAEEFSLPAGSWNGGTLQPGDMALLNIRFLPALTGSRSATLTINDDAADSPQTISLGGVGTAPLLRLSADSLLFAVQPAGSSAATQSLTLTNNGDAPLAIQGLSLSGPDAASFHLVSDTGEPSLNPGQSRTLTISFSPATTAGLRARIAAVSYKAALEIQHNDPHPDAPHTVTLFATTNAGPTGISIHPLPPTSLAPTTPPAAPTGLTAHAPSAGEVDLAWTDNSSNEQAFAIWRAGGGQDWARVGIMGPHATSYTDPTVQPGVAYRYKVRAIGGGGASDWSNTVSLTPGAPPAAPTGLAADAAGSTVTLTWSNQSTDEQAFAIWRQGGGSGWARVGIMEPGASSYTDPAVRPGTAYTYQVRAINHFGASGWSNTASVTTAAAPPAAPTGLAAAVSSGQVTLTWTGQSTDAHAFAIWRQGGGRDWARVGIAGPQAMSYTDSGLAAGTSYTYRVRAIGAGGASGWSNEVRVPVPAAP